MSVSDVVKSCRCTCVDSVYMPFDVAPDNNLIRLITRCVVVGEVHHGIKEVDLISL